MNADLIEILTADATTVPEWVHVLPRGEIHPTGHKAFVVDDAALDAILAGRSGAKVDLVVDYEHQSMRGEIAPAAGWIRELEKRDTGLWARVEWTQRAKEYIERREYRYLSPVLAIRKDRRPVVLVSVALTNTPAINELTPVANRATQEGDMDLKERLKEMGLEGSDDQLVAAIQGFRDKAVVADAVCGVLECTAGPDQAEGKVRELKLTAGQVEQYRASHNELVELKAETAVAEAEKAGKIAPTQRAEAVAWAKKDIEGFTRWMASQGPTIPVGPATHVAPAAAGDKGLTPEEEAFCRVLQLDPEKFKAA